MISFILKKFSFSKIEDFYAVVGYGGISLEKVNNKIVEYQSKFKKPTTQEVLDVINKNKPVPSSEKAQKGIIVKGIDNCLVRMAKCCLPVPGDTVVGYITRGRGVTIHRTDCHTLKNIEKSDGDKNRIIEVVWENANTSTHSVDMIITAVDRSGLLVDTTLALNDMKVPVSAMTAKVAKDSTFIINITLEILGQDQLSRVLVRLNNIKGVISAKRV
jgi:GTP pyrophosphokinase